MNQNRTLLSTVTTLVFLAIAGFALVVILTIFRETSPGSTFSTPGSTPVMTSSITPGPDGTQTIVAIITFKAIGEATEAARTPLPYTPTILSTGIYEDEPVKHSGKLLGLDAQNGWSGFVDGYYAFLYAGALLSTPEQGVIIMVITMPSHTSFEQYLTSTQHGALRVVSEQNHRLTLVAADEMVFYFDLPTRQFVTSLTEVAPSVTPSPLATPSPTGLPYPPPTTPETAIPL